jgi:hypothetical protein
VTARNLLLWALAAPVLSAFPAWSQTSFPLDVSVQASPCRRTETVLSGVNINSRNGEEEIHALIELLGKPTRKVDAPKNSHVHYHWELDGADLEVIVIHSEPLEPRIDSIDVRGRRTSGKIGVSGMGLALGSTVRDAAGLCPLALRYQTDWLSKRITLLNGHTTALLSADEFSPLLTIDFDHEVIVRMRLIN